MELVIRQIKKDLYDAFFEIQKDGIKAGSIVMQGALGSKEGRFQIQYGGFQAQMFPTSRKEASAAAGSLIRKSPFRPYVVMNDGSKGVMFHDQIKTGFMKSAGYHLLSWENNAYYLYFVGFGEKGICAPIYRNDNCIAEIHKDCIVKDDLHVLNIFLNESMDILPLLFLSSYMYVITYYQAGEKVSHGIQKRIIYTKNDYLLSKCKTLLGDASLSELQ